MKRKLADLVVRFAWWLMDVVHYRTEYQGKGWYKDDYAPLPPMPGDEYYTTELLERALPFVSAFYKRDVLTEGIVAWRRFGEENDETVHTEHYQQADC